jgi:hypothetical protein
VRKKKVALLRKKLHKMQSAVWCSSCHHHFVRGKKGMIKLQAVYTSESLIFIIRNNEELKEKGLNLF